MANSIRQSGPTTGWMPHRKPCRRWVAKQKLWIGRIKLISGETHRIAGGGAPMLDPALAEVQAALNAYTTKHNEQLRKKAAYDAAQEEVEAMRPAVDKMIKKLWNQIEFYFSEDTPSSLRRKARAWGVVYATRPDEDTRSRAANPYRKS